MFEVLATGGDTALGGDDFDAAVVSWILQQLTATAPAAGVSRQLSALARDVKEKLSVDESVTFELADIVTGAPALELDRAPVWSPQKSIRS